MPRMGWGGWKLVNSARSSGSSTPIGSGPATPTLVQHIGGGQSPSGGGTPNPGNNYKFSFLNNVGVHNCLILGITYPHGSTLSSISDSSGNTWSTTPTASADAGVGNMVGAIFVLANAAGGATTLTVNFSANVNNFQYTLSEFYNVDASPVNGSQSAAAVAGSSLATGSFTPGNNNANGGNLIWCYFCSSNAIGSGAPTSFVPGGSFTILDADIAFVSGSQGMPHSSQYFVQTASASINPGVTSTGDTGNTYNCVAVALKAANAGTAPGAGIRLVKMCHFSANNVALSSWKLQVPCTGNLRVIGTTQFSLGTTSVVDSDGNTWTKMTGVTPDVFYFLGGTPNTNLTITMTFSGTPTVFSARYWDITNAASSSVIDTTADTGSVSVPTTWNNAPTISPTSASGGLLIANGGVGQGPFLSFASGSPSGAVFDAIHYTGEPDNDYFDNADGLAHVYYGSGGGTFNWNWNMAIATSGDSSAFAFKSA